MVLIGAGCRNAEGLQFPVDAQDIQHLGAVRNLRVWLLIQDFSGTCPSFACRGENHLESKKCKREDAETQGHQHQTEKLQGFSGVAGSVSH